MTLTAFCCDLGERAGTGHVMRCLALAEELAGRGVECVFLAGFDDVPWARDQVADRGFGLVSTSRGSRNWQGELHLLDADAVVLDSYEAPASFTASLRRRGAAPLLAIVDHDRRGLEADLYLDQNIGARERSVPPGGRYLAGERYALMRDEVLRHRPRSLDLPAPTSVRRVLAYFGGTDAFAAGPVVATALAQSGMPLVATLVAPRAQLREAIERVAWQPGQVVEIIGPTSSLMALVAQSDLVISASGTSLSELLCIGGAAAVTCVTANQHSGYREAVTRGLVEGLGPLEDIRRDPTQAATLLRDVLGDDLRRQQLRRTGWRLVDGEGRRRVADALLDLTGAATT